MGTSFFFVHFVQGKKFTTCISFLKFLLAKKRVRNWSVWCARSALISARKLFGVWEVTVPIGRRHEKIFEILDTRALSACHFYVKILQIFSGFEQTLKNFNWLIKNFLIGPLTGNFDWQFFIATWKFWIFWIHDAHLHVIFISKSSKLRLNWTKKKLN